MNELLIAWAAGLFEGEGTVGTYDYKGRWTRANGEPVTYDRKITSARIVMTDEGTLLKFQVAVGFGRITGPYTRKGRSRAGHTPYFVWQAQRVADVKRLAELFRPFLSNRRLEQFAAALSAYSRITLED